MIKVSIIVLSDLERHEGVARVVNALEAVREFKEAGDEVELVFDGAGTSSAVAIADPEHKLHHLYALVEDKVAGLCKHCARAFDVYDKAVELGLPFLAEYKQHPSLRNRVASGYQIITF